MRQEAETSATLPTAGRRAKPPTRIQARNEARILDAALEAFSSYGYRGTTVDQIAEGAGMSKANVLYYFRRKQDMYVAVLERTLVLWLDPLERIDPDGDPIDEIWRYACVKLRLSRQAPRASRLFANEVLQGAPIIGPFLRTEAHELVWRKCGVIQAWIEQGRLAPVEPLHLIFTIWSVTQHYADFESQIDALHDGDAERLFGDAERTLRLLLVGGLSAGADAAGVDVTSGGATDADAAGAAADAASAAVLS